MVAWVRGDDPLSVAGKIVALSAHNGDSVTAFLDPP